jgi:hypothetical protein
MGASVVDYFRTGGFVMADEPIVCSHAMGSSRQVKNGQLLPEKDPCQICGLPRCVIGITYDTEESFERFPPENLDHLRCNDEPIKTVVGVDISEWDKEVVNDN